MGELFNSNRYAVTHHSWLPGFVTTLLILYDYQKGRKYWCYDWPTLRINVRENQRGNQEWTIQRHMQCWTHKTHDEDNQKKITQKRKVNIWATQTPPWNPWIIPVSDKISAVLLIVISGKCLVGHKHNTICFHQNVKLIVKGT